MMGDVKEKLRRDVETVKQFASDNLHRMPCADFVAMRQVCAALLDVLNKPQPAPESLPTGDALADAIDYFERVGMHTRAAALRSRQQVAEGYAGATVWIGDRRCTQIVSETEIKYERDTGNAITEASQRCLDILAAAKEPHP